MRALRPLAQLALALLALARLAHASPAHADCGPKRPGHHRYEGRAATPEAALHQARERAAADIGVTIRVQTEGQRRWGAGQASETLEVRSAAHSVITALRHDLERCPAPDGWRVVVHVSDAEWARLRAYAEHQLQCAAPLAGEDLYQIRGFATQADLEKASALAQAAARQELRVSKSQIHDPATLERLVALMDFTRHPLEHNPLTGHTCVLGVVPKAALEPPAPRPTHTGANASAPASPPTPAGPRLSLSEPAPHHCPGVEYTITVTSPKPARLRVYSLANDGRIMLGWPEATIGPDQPWRQPSISVHLAPGLDYRLLALTLPEGTDFPPGLPAAPGCLAQSFRSEDLRAGPFDTLKYAVRPPGHPGCPADPETLHRHGRVKAAIDQLPACR